jgi:hypothetical protein
MTRPKDYVPVLLPSVCGETHDILSDKEYAAWYAAYGDAFIKWMPMAEARLLHGRH